MPDQVFAYGSLAAERRGRPAVLRGHRRVWGVAMDNRESLPGYKAYLTEDGSRPDVCVAFLDVVPDPGCDVDGVLLDADAATLAALDARERNYERRDVTAAIALPPAPGGPVAEPVSRPRRGDPTSNRVWAYVGREESRERLRRARAEGRAVVHAAYARSVARWVATTDPPDLPEVELQRIELPPDA